VQRRATCRRILETSIKLVFHPLKAFLRKAAEQTIDGLDRSVGSFARAVARSQCVECFRHAGYKRV
jgi:hypothetical protein